MFSGYLHRIQQHHVVTGGLSFNTPTFGEQYYVLHASSLTWDNCDIPSHHPIIRDIGKIITPEMGQDGRTPIQISFYKDNAIHTQLSQQLKCKGIIDMWCKLEGSVDVVIPAELACIKHIIQPIIDFERQTNPNYLHWNMWLLVDTRKVLKGHTQRNSGFHYDGLNLAGKYAGTPNVSIYAWANRLPTLFCKKPVKYPDDFQLNHNASIYAQRMPKSRRDIVTFPNGTLLKFDGATVHSGADADRDIHDRVFVRVCFTAPGVWFDRKGNTINPFLIYPSQWTWRSVHDPSVKLVNTAEFDTAEEFKNMWDVACLGHHAFSTMYSGDKAHEHQLVLAIRKRGPKFLQNVLDLYSIENDEIGILRSNLLRLKFEI